MWRERGEERGSVLVGLGWQGRGRRGGSFFYFRRGLDGLRGGTMGEVFLGLVGGVEREVGRVEKGGMTDEVWMVWLFGDLVIWLFGCERGREREREISGLSL